MPLPLIHLAETDSTQSFLARHPELGFCGVLADAQTAGRGRGGNLWESLPGGGLWLSARVEGQGIQPGLLSQRAMAAVIAALEPCGLELGLKWPNDLVAWRGDRLAKVGGLLGEMTRDGVIFGVGVNLTEVPELPGRSLPAASLASLGARRMPDRFQLAEEILARWQCLDEVPEPAFLWPGEGDEIRWEEGEGTCLGWAQDGRLEVRTASGVRLLSVAEVRGLRG